MINLNSSNKKLINVDSNYVSGLTQADGSFGFSLIWTKKIKIKPFFSLTLHIHSKKALESVENYFNLTNQIYFNINKSCVELRVHNIEQFKNNIIPHYQKYPLFGRKNYVFLEFEKILTELNNTCNKNYIENIPLIEKIIGLNYTHSLHNKNYLKKVMKWERLLNIKLNKTTCNLIDTNFILKDQFIIGLIDGDGCFNINFLKNAKLKFEFQIIGDLSQKDLFLKIKNKFNSGTIQKEGINTLKYKINGKKQILSSIIPFMEIQEHKLYTEKKNHFEIFNQVIKKYHSKMNKQELLEIIELSYNMNLNGKRRKYTKEEYINKYLKT